MHTKFSHLSTKELVNLQDHIDAADQLDYLRELTERVRQMEYHQQVAEYEERLRQEKHG